MASAERSARPARLPDQSPNSVLAGPAGGSILRPWFDRFALDLIARWYLPLSRGWAAAVGARGRYAPFREAVGPVADDLKQARSALIAVDDLRKVYEATVEDWEQAFFSDRDPGPEALIRMERARVAAANRFMATRRLFLPIRSRLPAAGWDVASPDALRERQSKRLADPASAFPAPEPRPVYESRHVTGPRGPEFWVRMRAPSSVAGDTAWARVQAPREGPVRGVLILLHGIGVEPEMWRSMVAPAASLIDRGICLVSPEGPWHGKRCPPGEYGGERILGRGPEGFIELFEAWVAECALWTQWARDRFAAPVALGGVSLGALTSQMAVSKAGLWPERMRPDASILVTTTGDMTATAFEGSLAERTGLRARMLGAGWTHDALESFSGLLQPRDGPSLSPERIVMVLGSADTVTPFPGGQALAGNWLVPESNLFVRPRGHFTAALGLCRDPAPLQRLERVLLSD